MKPLFKEEEIKKTIRKPIEMNEFIALMQEHKPTKFYNTHYSKWNPYVVVEHWEEGVKMACPALADKTPKVKNYSEFYMWLYYQSGLEETYFV